MKRRYTQEKFAEDGPLYKIEISMLADVATLTIDTSGPGLHKRGYRLAQNDAPLRETVAAAMLWIAHWKPERVLCDPCCGSGTIAIEAALAARNIAPGLGRSFTAEQWPAMPKEIWHEAREEARSLINFSKPEIYASDIDIKSCKIAENNARAAGVADNIIIQKKPLAEYSSKRKYGCLICNPPWGERMSEQKEVEVLSREIGQLMDKLDSWSYFILSGNEKFEAMCGKKASRNRKLYNGKLKTYLYQYLGPLPPRPPRDKPAAENQG
jgi:putative N6-adenine-specific DNA methylase